MECLICLSESDSLIGVTSEEGKARDLVKILKTHFSFLEHHFSRKKKIEKSICSSCLDTIDQFHSFYVTIKEKHDSNKSHSGSSRKQNSYEIEDVTLKQETDIKKEIENDSDVEITLQNSRNEDNIPLKSELEDEEFKLSNEELDSDSDLEHQRSKKKRPLKSRKKQTEDSSEDEETSKTIRNAKSIKFINEFWTSSMICDICQYNFKDYADMRTHFLKNHKKQTGYLVCCNVKHLYLQKMVDHIKKHQNPQTYTCETCDKTYSSLRSLSCHRKSHKPREGKPKKQYVCTFNDCNKVYINKYLLETHRIIAHIPKEDWKFVCKICNTRFPTSGRLNTHHRLSHEESNDSNKFICDLCGRVLKNKFNLQQHIQLHSDDDSKRIQCEICFHWLKNKNQFRIHSLRHTREFLENSVCSYCGKKLANKQSLANHIKVVHFSQYIFKCTMCEKAFKTKLSLKEHTATHSGQYLYECNFCGKHSNSVSNMHAHKKRMHPKEWVEYLQPKHIKPISAPLPHITLQSEME